MHNYSQTPILNIMNMWWKSQAPETKGKIHQMVRPSLKKGPSVTNIGKQETDKVNDILLISCHLNKLMHVMNINIHSLVHSIEPK